MTTLPEATDTIRADTIRKGDVIEEDGMDPIRIRRVKMHGDTVLLWATTLVLDENRKIVDRANTESTLDCDDFVGLISRAP